MTTENDILNAGCNCNLCYVAYRANKLGVAYDAKQEAREILHQISNLEKVDSNVELAKQALEGCFACDISSPRIDEIIARNYLKTKPRFPTLLDKSKLLGKSAFPKLRKPEFPKFEG